MTPRRQLGPQQRIVHIGLNFIYIGWLGAYMAFSTFVVSPNSSLRLTIPILNSQHQVIAVLGGMPHDVTGWKTVTEGTAALLHERAAWIQLTDEWLHHCHAQDTFPAIRCGWSHGSGQLEPGELCNNATNTWLSDELLQHKHFRHLAHFANSADGAPHSMEAVNAAELHRQHLCCLHLQFWPTSDLRVPSQLHQSLVGVMHDHGPGRFRPRFGGPSHSMGFAAHHTLPPWLHHPPSALIQHSNVSIQSHEYRASFTQYTAGGLFCWVQNSFKTDEDFQADSIKEEKAACKMEDGRCWAEGMKMFSVIDDLQNESNDCIDR
ncbi:hypothetical protein FB451DRAFT_1173673 [Mycena latifolia]|nr:hypothetical protein FB451DRAFT_1173673 [Mycena latifolia]